MGIPDEREARADQDMRVLPFEAADFLAAIVASSDDAIVSKNLSGVITTWNKGAELVRSQDHSAHLARPAAPPWCQRNACTDARLACQETGRGKLT